MDMPVIGLYINEMDEVDSTNTYLENQSLLTDLPEGTVIWAHNQFKGKGQRDHTWVSEPGKNLTCSTLLRPVFLSPDRQFLLNKAIALGVLDFVSATLRTFPESEPAGALTRIKWPNDIYISHRKVGGILITHRIMGNEISQTIVGIGVNINQEVFSPEIPNPASLIHYTCRALDLRKCLNDLCSCLDRRYADLRRTGALSDEEYANHLYGSGQICRFLADGHSFSGTILGVDDTGRLIIQQQNGSRSAYAHQEVEMTGIPSGEKMQQDREGTLR